MKAMILAAGRGERLRPLTEHTPKPLIQVGGKTLIEYHLEKLSQAGIQDVVINVAYLGEKIRKRIGSGKAWQLNIEYSQEPEPLETAGAIRHALPLLGEQAFLLVNADIWTDISFQSLSAMTLGTKLGHLLLVNNPNHNRAGDYSILNNILVAKSSQAYTFSGISVLSPKLLTQYPQSRRAFPLREVLT